ncbi:MAG: hypothetical protein ACRDRN_10035 [Sciscionella sp.]
MTTVLLLVAAAVLLPLVRKWARASGRTPNRRRSRSMLAVIALLVLQMLVLAPPASAADCQVPNPEIPGAGMVGALDPPSEAKGTPNSPYQQYSYAGLRWYTYTCSSFPDPSATVDTWVGNEMFNVGKNMVGATNSLHYTLLGGDLLKPLDSGIAKATKALYEGPYVQWLWLPLLLLAVFLFRHIWHGDLAAMGRRSMWALAGLAVAAAAYATPLFYTHLLDDVLITGTSQIQGGFLPSIGIDERNALPTALHNEVVYKNWLRGEFGQPDGPNAKSYGPRLLDAQALTKQQAAQADQTVITNKEAKFKAIAGELKAKHADGYFTGRDGSRTGDGFLAAFQGVAYSLFQLLAKAAVLLGQVLMRVVVLASPLIGFIAVVYHDLLRKVGQAVAAVVLNVVVLAVLAGLHTKLLMMIFDPASQLSLLTQLLLATLVTAIFLVVGRPIRRMRQMVELSVGAAGMAVPSAGPRRFGGFRGRRREEVPVAQDAFWDNVRSGGVQRAEDAEESREDPQRRRVRPEMSNPLVATAQRLDNGTERRPDGVRQLDGTGGRRSEGRAALPAAYPPGGYPGPAGARLEASLTPAARAGGGGAMLGAFPLGEHGRHRNDEPVVVPSQVTARQAEPARAEFGSPAAARRVPRRADAEVVGGRPVFVLYRPSRGFEVRDTELFEHDTPVRG